LSLENLFMSQTETESPSSRLFSWPLVAGVGAVLVLALLAWLVFRPTKRLTKPVETKGEDSTAVQPLAHDTDLNTCRATLQQINDTLGLKSEAPEGMPILPADELRHLFGLDEGALGELSDRTYSLLDGQYLDQCFLMRDAAQSLQVSGLPVRPTPLDRAATAFAWTMRQVRLEEDDPEIAPPAFVLRRGWGSSVERALVFLALLQQVASASELQGCLVYCPDKKDGAQRLWACGVVVEGGRDVYLFDPRLGLPLPGPKDGSSLGAVALTVPLAAHPENRWFVGALARPMTENETGTNKSIATLDGVVKHPSLLDSLNVKETDRYDVTADLASAAQVRLVCPLSGLSPRMRYLQDKILAPHIRVHLAVNALEEFERLRKAVGKERLAVWKEVPRNGPILDGPGLLRRFLPPEEGGVDTQKRFDKYRYLLAPWGEMPARFKDENKFPSTVGLGQRIRVAFAIPFIQSVTDPQKPRNLILRGRFNKASTELKEEQDRIHRQVELAGAQNNLDEQVDAWVKSMFALYADQLRAKQQNNASEVENLNREIEEMWSKKSSAVGLLLNAATAGPRRAEVKYLQALCKHNQAAQTQARLDAQANGKAPVPETEVLQGREAWEDARSSWNLYLQDFPDHSGARMAHNMRAQSLVMLGQLDKAAEEWEQLTVKGPEKVAALYLAQQARQARAKK
jgi:hypothetical protein